MEGELYTDDGQLEFDFVERKPVRRLKRYDCPHNDNERLLNYQADWLEKQDPEAWSSLWQLSGEVAMRMIQAQMRKKRFYLDSMTMQDRASDAVIYVLRRFRKGWYVKRSFISALKGGVVHALYHRPLSEEKEIPVPDELIKQMQEQHLEEKGHRVIVDGMSTEQAKSAVVREFLPGIADDILTRVEIRGGKK